MFHKILVAIDEFNSNENVLRCALNLAKAMGSKVLLIHVLNPASKDYPIAFIDPAFDTYYPLHNEIFKRWQEELSEYEQHQQGVLRSLASEAEAVGVTTEIAQNVGDPGQTICSVAKTWEADLIILGRRGRSGINELLLGSVSNYVLHHAPCSVLIVQGKAEPNLESEHQEAATVR